MTKLYKEILIIVSFTFLGSALSLFSGLSPKPWQTPELEAGVILPEDARVLDIIWIDARSEAEFLKGKIENAILLNEEQWDEGFFNLMNAWLEETKPIVVYCGSKSCGTSKKIAQRLWKDLPDAEIYSLKGGWEAWDH